MPKSRTLVFREKHVLEIIKQDKNIVKRLLTCLGDTASLDNTLVEAEYAIPFGNSTVRIDLRLINGGCSTFVEYQVGKANLDHAKALIYPLLADADRGVWIAADFPLYVVRAVDSLNAIYKGAKSFYLVKASKILAKKVSEIEDEAKRIQFELVCKP